MPEAENEDLLRLAHTSVREVYRDQILWALDKPAGILTHPNPPSRSAPNALFRGDYDFEQEAYQLKASGGRRLEVHLVHRLDQETSGIILCSFRAEAAAQLKEDLFHREVQKEYRALLLGLPSPRRGEWQDRLEKISRGGKATVVARPGRPNAVTAYNVLETFDIAGAALVALFPETGRTHQLRVQTSSRGWPIAGDDRYGDFTANKFLAAEIGLKRMFLHAYRIEMRHPTTGHGLRLEAPMTSRLLEPLAKLRELAKRVPRREK